MTKWTRRKTVRLSALRAHYTLRLVLDQADPSTMLAAVARDALEMLALVYEADLPDKAAELARNLNQLSCLIAYTELLKKKAKTPWVPPGNTGSDGPPVAAEVAVWLPPTGTIKH